MLGRPLLVFAALSQAVPAFAASKPAQYMDVELIADTDAPRPGSSVLVGLKMTPRAGWHGYWSNAGESGLSPTVRWSAPTGVKFGSLQHPAPTLLRVMGLTSYVHAGAHVLIARMKVSEELAVGTPLPMAADVNFAVCSDRLCVPQRVKLALQLVAGDGAPSPEASLLKLSLTKLPAATGSGRFNLEDGLLTLVLPATVHLRGSETRFFPDQNGFFDPSRARTLSTKPLRIVTTATGEPPATITGVLSDGSAAMRVRFRKGKLPSHDSSSQVGMAPSPSDPKPLAAPPNSASTPWRAPKEASTQSPKGYPDVPGHSPATALLVAAAALIALGSFFWFRHRR